MSPKSSNQPITSQPVNQFLSAPATFPLERFCSCAKFQSMPDGTEHIFNQTKPGLHPHLLVIKIRHNGLLVQVSFLQTKIHTHLGDVSICFCQSGFHTWTLIIMWRHCTHVFYLKRILFFSIKRHCQSKKVRFFPNHRSSSR